MSLEPSKPHQTRKSSDQFLAIRHWSAVWLIIPEILLIGTSALWDFYTDSVPWVKGLYLALYSLLLCAGGYAMVGSKRWLRVYTVFFFGTIIAGVMPESVSTQITFSICMTGAYCMLFGAIILYSFIKPRVPQMDRILAGIAGYMLLGLFWTNHYKLITTFTENAFWNQVANRVATPAEQLYFSFVTLTTLGYGDIVPGNPISKVIVVFTTLSGVLYLAVFISILVSNIKREQ